MWLAGTKQDLRGRAARRRYPIHFYEGRNGASKSLCAVWDTMPSLDSGRPALSTVRLLDWNDPRPCEGFESYVKRWVHESGNTWRAELGRQDCSDLMHGFEDHRQAHPLYVPFTSWEQLLAWRFGDVLMDEITGVADSNESSRLPAAVGNFLAQLRRYDVATRITGLGWMRANKRLRESVVAVTRCRTSLPVPPAKGEDAEARQWRPRRLAKWVTFDAKELPLDDISATAWENATVLGKCRHWIPTSPAINAYDTFAPVLSVGSVSEAGRCYRCDGTRSAPKCTCPDYVDRVEHARQVHSIGRPPVAGARHRSKEYA